MARHTDSTSEGSGGDAGVKTPSILTINGGSSSIKFAVFRSTATPECFLHGEVERIGTPGAQLTASGTEISATETTPIAGGTFEQCVESLVNYLRRRLDAARVAGIGHRIVHGGLHLLEHQRVAPEVLAELRAAQPLDLAHLPREIALLEAFAAAFPGVAQVACFDTAFHRNLPRVAQMLPIPRRFYQAGVRRFGFHGLSYTYLMKQLAALAGNDAANGQIILAHLGSGASMAAVHNGRPIDTTMAFTPLAGLVMGTRPGDLDPGLVLYLMNEQKLSSDAMEKFLAQECGMLGVSETGSDMRDLLARRGTDERAADAVALFCCQARKYLGAMAAALGGLDTLVFSGGIGEHSPEVRGEICDDLAYLGVKIDRQRNAAGENIISTTDSRVTVRVIATDEEFIIAETVRAIQEGKSV